MDLPLHKALIHTRTIISTERLIWVELILGQNILCEAIPKGHSIGR